MPTHPQPWAQQLSSLRASRPQNLGHPTHVNQVCPTKVNHTIPGGSSAGGVPVSLVPKALRILTISGTISPAVLTGRWLGCHYPHFILHLLGAGGEHTFHSTHLGVRDSLKGSFLSFHHMGPGDQIQILDSGVKCLSLLNHLTGSHDPHFIGDKN